MDEEDKENREDQVGAPLLTCDGRGCPKTFATRSGIFIHTKMCTFQRVEKGEKERDYWKDEEGLVRCKKCPVTFTKLVNFYRHNKEIHISGKEVKKKTAKVYKCCLFQAVTETSTSSDA